jgi:hypothetical protein
MIDKTMAKRIATQLGWEPPREWVGLTEEEAQYLFRLCLGRPYDDFWHAIEAKLREKNSTSAGKINISNTISVKSAQLEGHIMNDEYTAGEADAWINGHRVGKKHGDQLRRAVKEFFEEYLDVVEESDSGRMFNPITINCCRALKLEPLGRLLIEMRALSGARSEEENT